MGLVPPPPGGGRPILGAGPILWSGRSRQDTPDAPRGTRRTIGPYQDLLRASGRPGGRDPLGGGGGLQICPRIDRGPDPCFSTPDLASSILRAFPGLPWGYFSGDATASLASISQVSCNVSLLQHHCIFSAACCTCAILRDLSSATCILRTKSRQCTILGVAWVKTCPWRPYGPGSPAFAPLLHRSSRAWSAWCIDAA